MLLVTGATGPLGGAVVRRLLERVDATDIAILVRDPAKAASLAELGVGVRVGDYDDTASLARAFTGIERALLVASNDPERRGRQHQNVIDAALHADVALLGFASRALRDITSSRNDLMGAYFQTEDRIKASGVPYVLFRNALYLDTVPLYVAGAAVFDHGIALPAGNGRVAYALRRELGEALANGMLDHQGPNRTHTVAGPQTAGLADIATALTDLSGRHVSYRPTSDEDYIARTVHDRGIPEHLARRFLGFFLDIRDGQLDETSNDLHTLLGREPVTLHDGLRELFTL